MSATSASHKPIDYRTVFFIHQSLTIITNDPPNFDDITLLQREVLANASSVPTTLGGGRHGHAGMVLSDTAYGKESATPYFKVELPTDQAAANLNALTQHQIIEANRLYNNQVNDFHTGNHIERTLIAQIQEALPVPALSAVTKRNTGIVNLSIPDLFTYLYKTFGNITPQSHAAARAKAISHKYDHSQPMANVLNVVNTFADQAEAFGAPESDIQLVNFGMHIITSSTTIFSHDIRQWNRQRQEHKTWANFQLHFTEAQEDYKLSRPTEAPISTANLGYVEQMNVMESYVRTLEKAMNESPPPSPADYIGTPTPATIQEANATQSSSDAIQLRILEELSRLNAHSTKSSYKGKGKDKDKKKANSSRSTTNNTQLYCWSHGACSHIGADCKNPAQGHKTDATFNDMKNGSNKNCFWLQTNV